MTVPPPSTVFYLAVLPAYRQRCIDILLTHRPDVKLFCAPAHLDPSVRTGIKKEQYTEVRLTRIFGKFFVQSRGIRAAVSAGVLVVDLNPRSATAWLLLVTRRILHRRTIVWGHLYPQAGEQARTRGLRHTMRRLAHGTVSYTYQNAAAARREMPDRPVWVAPNALYTRDELKTPLSRTEARTNLLYVGRFEPAKKVALLVRAFAMSNARREGAVLTLIGDGSQRPDLEADVAASGLSSVTVFRGWVQDFDQLRDEYSRAFLATSPGFAGLGLTQSLGFGVPILVATNEPHSPEIELETLGGLIWAESDNPIEWANEIDRAWQSLAAPSEHLRDRVADLYSADAMATGLIAAVEGRQDSEYGQ